MLDLEECCLAWRGGMVPDRHGIPCWREIYDIEQAKSGEERSYDAVGHTARCKEGRVVWGGGKASLRGKFR